MENTIRPIIYKLEPNKISILFNTTVNVTYEDALDISDTVIFSIMSIIDERDLDENRQINYRPSMELLNSNYVMEYKGLESSLGKAVRLAEHNLGKLREFLQIYFFHHKFEDVISRNSDCKKCQSYSIDNTCNKLTFMQMRNILSCIIKTDTTFHKIDSLNSPEKRKNFTKFYEGYISDRDYYTHGKIYFMDGTMKPLLGVIVQNKGEQFLEISNEIFLDNEKLFHYLNPIILEMQTLA